MFVELELYNWIYDDHGVIIYLNQFNIISIKSYEYNDSHGYKKGSILHISGYKDNKYCKLDPQQIINKFQINQYNNKFKDYLK
mgnify:CR=1 FL=1